MVYNSIRVGPLEKENQLAELKTSGLPYLGIILLDLKESTLKKRFLVVGKALGKFSDGCLMPFSIIWLLASTSDKLLNEAIVDQVGLGQNAL